MGLEARQSEAIALFTQLMAPSGSASIASGPRWPSDVCDDGTPFEFSVAFSERSVLRLMVEPIAELPSLAANARLARDIVEDIASSYDLDLRRLDRVWDLFVPPEPSGRFSVWLAAELAHGETGFKIYLNPEARGPGLGRATVEEAFARLGFDTVWPLISRTIGRRGPTLDELKFVSLDLARSDHARVKVYGRHHRSTTKDLEAAASASPSYRHGEVTEFLQIVAPDHPQLNGRGPWTCLAFVQGDGDPQVTTHFPINGYAETDQVTCDRTVECLRHYGLPHEPYMRAIDVLVPGPLEAGIGTQSYVSFRRSAGKPRVTTYFPTEAYRPYTVASPTMPEPASTATELFRWYDVNDPLSGHPFLHRMAREPVRADRLWQLLENLATILPNHSRQLAEIVARVDDDVLRSLLVQQLHELCGRGSAELAYARAFARSLKALDDWRPADRGDRFLAPAEGLALRQASIFSGADASASLGAMAVSYVYMSQLLVFVRDEAGRARADDKFVGAAFADLITSTESLIAAMHQTLPARFIESAWEGAAANGRAYWRFLDDLYADCYGTLPLPSSAEIGSGTHRAVKVRQVG